MIGSSRLHKNQIQLYLIHTLGISESGIGVSPISSQQLYIPRERRLNRDHSRAVKSGRLMTVMSSSSDGTPLLSLKQASVIRVVPRDPLLVPWDEKFFCVQMGLCSKFDPIK
jgi:hypothetical protein